MKNILDDSFSASPLATVERSYGDMRPGELNNARFFVRVVKAYQEDFTECRQKHGKGSAEYNALLAKAQSFIGSYLPEFLDLAVLGYISDKSNSLVPSL